VSFFLGFNISYSPKEKTHSSIKELLERELRVLSRSQHSVFAGGKTLCKSIKY